MTFSYDILGNITNKSDVGGYTYGAADTSCASNTAGPHAVSSITGTKTASYCYDANGNMTSGDGRTITWSPFGKPLQITRGANRVTFAYGPDRARYKRVDNTLDGQTTTIYLGGARAPGFEEITKPNGDVEFKHYIAGVAVVTETIAFGGVESSFATNYLSRDHLGSVDVITDETGAIAQAMSFDVWGKRRTSNNWSALSMAAITTFDTSITTRGFGAGSSAHEQIDSVGLVHMNGRVYDPELGRFLSADPNLQDLSNLQAWNRYSYVLNNPLSLVDPTGYFFGSLFKAIGKLFSSIFKAVASIFKAIVNSSIFRAIIQIVACSPMAVAATFGISCAGAAFGMTLAAGGSIGDALLAAGLAFAQIEVWSFVGQHITGPLQMAMNAAGDAFNLGFAMAKGAIHGIVGGALSVIQGGSFISGFASSAVSGFGSQVIGASGLFGEYGDGNFGGIVARAAASAAVGCGGAVASGGSCANGAVTAAFASMYNGEGKVAKPRSADRWTRFIPKRFRLIWTLITYIFTPYKQPPYGVAIGEDMDGRVIPYAKKHGLLWYEAAPDTPKSMRMEYNRIWIRKVMDDDALIVDIGAAPDRPLYPLPTSKYYAMELMEIEARGYQLRMRLPNL